MYDTFKTGEFRGRKKQKETEEKYVEEEEKEKADNGLIILDQLVWISVLPDLRTEKYPQTKPPDTISVLSLSFRI